jgi:photosystem II stability/assembly factor-like uncharacterized protein
MLQTHPRELGAVRRLSGRTFVVIAGAVIALVIVAVHVLQPFARGTPVPWARLGTEDVHSLAFAPGSIDRLYFGHHGGILESSDGGRSWAPLPVAADAMGMRPAADGSIVIAGHEVFVASPDGGRTWSPIEADLPNLDIHAFARDQLDPRRMWAYLAEGGVYESTDGGTHWASVYDGHIPFMTTTTDGSSTTLVGIEPFSGFARSADGGRTWAPVSQPEAFPTYSIAATSDGRVIALGVSDGILRSGDGGVTWTAIELPSPAMAIALSDDGRTIVVATQTTDVYRSDDGGRTWPGL